MKKLSMHGFQIIQQKCNFIISRFNNNDISTPKNLTEKSYILKHQITTK